MHKKNRWIWFSHCLLLAFLPLSSRGETHVGGAVEGVWSPVGNPYFADSTIIIQPNTSLLILPGVILQFINPDSIKVYGTLVAKGTREDSIYFRDYEKPTWRGVWFMNECTACTLEYVSIDHPKWGVRVDHSQPTIRFCNIQAQSVGVGGHYADFELRNCVISVDAPEADGIRLYHSDAYIYGCDIYATENMGAENAVGIRIIQSNPRIWYSGIHIVANGLACGIWAEETSKANIFYNLIDSRSENLAFGSLFILSSPSFVNNTVAVTANLNSAKCLYLLQDSNPTIENCILYGDGSSEGIVAQVNSNPDISFSNLFNHASNAVGCTTGVGSISENPLFANAGAGDFNLTRHSPCIDAGNPSSPLDPDSTRADMGCFYFDGTVPVEESELPPSPVDFELLEVFPNPFNAQSQLQMNLPAQAYGQLLVYNQQGCMVEVIEAGLFPAGESRVIWDAASLSSGIYWMVLKTSLGIQARRICLLK